jgi:Uma2 family endonuclease
MATSLKRDFVSLEEYFALDSTSSERCEYRNGEVHCMGGAQPEHNSLCVNLLAELRFGLRGSGCRPFGSDQRVRVSTGSPYLYPDLAVACEPAFVTINGLRTLVNPLLIIEVTSPSTAREDRGAKFLQYQTIETLVDYVLVDSTAIGVLHYYKQEGCNRDGLWSPQVREQAADELILDRLGLSIPLATIYADSGIGGAEAC